MLQLRVGIATQVEVVLASSNGIPYGTGPKASNGEGARVIELTAYRARQSHLAVISALHACGLHPRWGSRFLSPASTNRCSARTKPRRMWHVKQMGWPCGIVAAMHRLCALIVFAAVCVNAVWCVDGCIDRFAGSASYSTSSSFSTPSSNSDSSESTNHCVVCVVPFEQLQIVTVVLRQETSGQIPKFEPDDPPATPTAGIDHPPRPL